MHDLAHVRFLIASVDVFCIFIQTDAAKCQRAGEDNSSPVESPYSRAAGRWIFNHFFDGWEIFLKLADYCNKDLYRFEFKMVGEKNKALKLLDMRGFDVDLVEDLKGYVVSFPGTANTLLC